MRSTCRSARNRNPFYPRLPRQIVIELTALDLRCRKLSGLRHLLQFAPSETDRSWSNFRELTINQNYTGRFDLSTFGARSEHASTRFEFVTHDVLTESLTPCGSCRRMADPGAKVLLTRR